MILMYDLPLQNAIMIFFKKKKKKRKEQYIVKICAIEMVRFVKSHIFNQVNELKYIIIPHT